MTPVRFQEHQRYDITQDAEVTLFTAITPSGCYYAEVKKDGFMKYREQKQAFRDRAIELITSGKDPCKVEL